MCIGKEETHNGDNSVMFEKRVKVPEKFNGKEFNGLCSAGKHVVDDIVILNGVIRLLAPHELGSIFNDRNMIRWEVEVLSCEPMDNRVDLDDCRLDSMVDQCSRSSTGSKTTRDPLVGCCHFPRKQKKKTLHDER